MSGWQIVALVAVVLAWENVDHYLRVLAKRTAHRSALEVLTARKPFDQEQQ